MPPRFLVSPVEAESICDFKDPNVLRVGTRVHIPPNREGTFRPDDWVYGLRTARYNADRHRSTYDKQSVAHFS